MNKSLSQTQFGQNAAEYLTSKPHAQGQSLERMVALAAPQPDWHVLDVATGAGHTAYAFAPHVARVVGDRHHRRDARAGARRGGETQARQRARRPRQGRGAAVRGRELRSRHLPHRAASLRQHRGVSRRDPPRAQAGRHLRAGRQRGAGGQRRRLRQCVRALPRSEPPARLDHRGMARRRSRSTASASRTRRSCPRRWTSPTGPAATTPTCSAFLRAMLHETTPAVKAFLMRRATAATSRSGCARRCSSPSRPEPIRGPDMRPILFVAAVVDSQASQRAMPRRSGPAAGRWRPGHRSRATSRPAASGRAACGGARSGGARRQHRTDGPGGGPLAPGPAGSVGTGPTLHRRRSCRPRAAWRRRSGRSVKSTAARASAA